MARRHGRNGRMYMDIAGGGSAASINFIAKWSLSFTTERTDVTGMGDANKVYVAGLPDAKGTYSGFFDDATAQMYTAATDGIARKFYLYPDITNAPGVYWFGTTFPDFSVSGGVEEAVAISGSFDAATQVIKVG